MRKTIKVKVIDLMIDYMFKKQNWNFYDTI